MTNYQFLHTQAELKSIQTQIINSKVLSLDTEFLKRKSFYATPALLQIKYDDKTILLDLLTITNKDLLKNIFAQTKAKILIHASSEDINLLYHAYNIKLANFYDTQIMADWILSNTTSKSKLSYANLVYLATGIELPKSETNSNWLNRPLTAQQMDYAADDVEYLLPSFEFLLEQDFCNHQIKFNKWQLNILKICELESSYKAAHVSKFDKYPSDYRLYDGKFELTKAELARLAAINTWRLEAAKLHNMPIKWILTDKDMLTLTKINDLNKHKILQNSSINPVFIRKYGDILFHLLDENLAKLHKFKLPINIKSRDIQPIKKKWQDNIKQFQRANKLENISLISNKTMALMLSDYFYNNKMQNYNMPQWRFDLLKSCFPI